MTNQDQKNSNQPNQYQKQNPTAQKPDVLNEPKPEDRGATTAQKGKGPNEDKATTA